MKGLYPKRKRFIVTPLGSVWRLIHKTSRGWTGEDSKGAPVFVSKEMIAERGFRLSTSKKMAQKFNQEIRHNFELMERHLK